MTKPMTIYFDEDVQEILKDLTKGGKKVSPLVNDIIKSYYSKVGGTTTKDDFAELLRIVARLNATRKERGLLFLDELPTELVEQIQEYKKVRDKLQKTLNT